MYHETDQPLRGLEVNFMLISKLKIGQLYLYGGQKLKLIAIEGRNYIFWREDKSSTITLLPDGQVKERISCLSLWEDKAVFDGWMNVYPNGSMHVHMYKEHADGMADLSRLDCLRVRYDSSKPLKDRIKVVCDE